MESETRRHLSCQCGKVEFQATGQPIVTAVCYCVDCQAAGTAVTECYEGAVLTDPDGGTAYVTWHDRQWQAVRGQELLAVFKLSDKSETTRYIASCCHTPIYIKYSKGFWTSTYRNQYDDPPALEWRNKVSARQSDLPFEDTIPRYRSFPLKLFWRLLKGHMSS